MDINIVICGEKLYSVTVRKRECCARFIHVLLDPTLGVGGRCIMKVSLDSTRHTDKT